MATVRDLSPLFKKEISALSITAAERIFVDLWKRCEYTKDDAWALSGMKLPRLTAKEQKAAQDAVLEKASVAAYVKHVSARAKAQAEMVSAPQKATTKKVEQKDGEDLSEDEMQMMLSKDYQLKECLKALKHCEVGTKEWLDIKKMIADITQVKKEQTSVEDKLLHVYMPAKCSLCGYRSKVLEEMNE